jgi:SAM-dependent methyltransferase
MTALTTLPMLSERRSFVRYPRDLKTAERFESYVQSRRIYKTELVKLLADVISAGPVLELTNGFGSIGLELLRARSFTLHTICDGLHAKQLIIHKLRDTSFKTRCHIWPSETALSLLPGNFFECIYSVNCLHEWNYPVDRLKSLWKHLRVGGVLVLNDIKRDADPFLVEYVIREYASEETEDAHFRRTTFLTSLQSAYTTKEALTIMQQSDIHPAFIEENDPMALTICARKQD